MKSQSVPGAREYRRQGPRPADLAGNRLLSAARLMAVAVPVVFGAMTPTKGKAQSVPGQPPAVRAQTDWEIAAGGKLAFEVASVRQNKSDKGGGLNVSLLPGDNSLPNGGFFSGTNLRLASYMYFAYKLEGNAINVVVSQLNKFPGWVMADHFDIQAKAEGSPTKDQMRLMVQSLLADRFNLKWHYETREVPIFAVVLAKPGKTGPQLRSHPNDSSCVTESPSATPGSAAKPVVDDGFPPVCGRIQPMPRDGSGRSKVGGRNVPVQWLVNSFLAQVTDLDRPLVDQTGLSGNYDFTFAWAPRLRGDPNVQPDESAPTFQEAMKEQLGLKLEPKKGLVEILVIDHIDHPSAN